MVTRYVFAFHEGSTEACRFYLASGAVPDGLDGEFADHLATLERARGSRWSAPHADLAASGRRT